jgi:ABC-2 type transport system permease protein
MSILERVRPPSPPATALELAKLGAFVRRDFQIAWSYRMSFVSEWITLAIQVAMFAYVGRLIDPAVLPTYGGVHATYMQFVTIGVAVSALMHLALGRVASGLRTEQLTGTLEPLMLTPTTPATIQFGTVLYDLIYIPLRLAVFLGVVAAVFNLSFDPSGIAPAFVLLLALMPFVWGLGVANAASALTFRRGGAGIGLMISLIALGSGAYFPLELLPHWLYVVVRLNPVAVAITGIRRELIGGEGWAILDWNLAFLALCSLVAVGLGLVAFQLALRRERRRGSLGLY